MKKVGIFFVDRFEEIEALTVVDLLRRAGIEITMASVEGKKMVTGSHNISVEMDASIDDIDFDSLDMIVCPGGPGTKNLEKCEKLMAQVKSFHDNGKYIAAICAAPMIFGHMGLLEGKNACIFPGMEEELIGAKVCFDDVVQSDNMIMSRGMGTAMAFGLKIVEVLLGKEAEQNLGKQIVYYK